MRSPLLDLDDVLDDPALDPETDPDVETATAVGPPPIRMRDYRAETAKGLRQPGTTYATRQARPRAADGAPVRSPWETLPREGATALMARRFAEAPATSDVRVKGIEREFTGVR